MCAISKTVILLLIDCSVIFTLLLKHPSKIGPGGNQTSCVQFETRVKFGR